MEVENLHKYTFRPELKTDVVLTQLCVAAHLLNDSAGFNLQYL